jgi:2'-hydroxyisoflavone reductase
MAACSKALPKESPVSPPAPATPAKKSILVLGGTNFLGPHVVDAALARGHTVTLFNRGKTHAELYPDLEKLHGDRDGHLEALAGRKWDAVVDPSGYVPRIVKMSAELLAPSVGHYVFISTISVYASLADRNADETAAVRTMPDPTNEDRSNGNYGAQKALSEAAAEAAMPGRVLNVRPGLIVGPGDPTGRFTHWPSRLREGGDVLAPGDGATPVQWIDGRDLGAWIVRAIEQRSVGVMNALGPEPGEPMRDVLAACNKAGGDKAKLVWVPADFLDAHDVSGWSELPMWLPNTGDTAGFGTRSNARAVAAGLTMRPIYDTAVDTLKWLDAQPEAERPKLASTGITRDKEAKVIADYRAKG